MKSKIGIIIAREYLQRVRKKSFIITTIATPILLLVLMCLPAILMNVNMTSAKEVGVIDPSGKIAEKLVDSPLATFTKLDMDPDSISAEAGFDAFLILPSNVIERPVGISLYSRDAGTMMLESYITQSLDDIIEQERLDAMDMGNLKSVLKEIEVNSSLNTFKLNESNEVVNSSTTISYVIGLIMSAVLYFFLLMYGQMVMTSIVEEKSNRVLELIVTSVKPMQIMMGKIIGVGCVALTQLAVWAVIILGATMTLLPMIISPELAGDISAFNAGTLDATQASIDIEGIQALSIVGDTGYLIGIMGWLLLFLLGGFLLYAAIYAAIGSAIDNVQDGSQLQAFVLIPLIISFFASTTVAANPDSGLAFWLSIVPFTSPLVMMTRIPFDIPVGEIILSLVILYISFILMVWLAGKIYRVGIFMYGKKPTIKDLIRWARY
ncbi:MAG: ABC transporter permease [Muribaculaceae bacterium]|nr:ABC transporter permease [Muribaculaceae bacterium]MDE6832558.1 ABC transporter permease [Muribaculaceae bacterium]